MHAAACGLARMAYSRLGGRALVQVISQLQILFTPDPRLIKSRINDLIEREYLARKEGDATAYVYKA